MNSNAADAAAGMLGAPLVQKVCIGSRAYIKYGAITASAASPRSFHVVVDYTKATEDVADAYLGVLEAGRSTITTGMTASGSCSRSSNPNDEDCVFTVTASGELTLELVPFSGAPDNATVTVSGM